MHLLQLINSYASSTGDAKDLDLMVFSDAMEMAFSFKNIGMHSYTEIREFNFTAIPCNEFLVLKMQRNAEHQRQRIHSFRFECSTLGFK